MSFEASGKSSIETTESHFFYDVVVRRSIEAEVYFNGKLVNKSNRSTKRRIVPNWRRILVASAMAVAGLFLCAKLVGF
jgi:hypothetical protein